jgi:2-polyprenyl-3-methyl-5-hydroxy-6-metoxy-1,4-benzoquinol methylase
MKSRSAETEQLDDLALHGETLYKALQSLAWINRWFGNHRAVIKAIQGIYKKEEKVLSIVDLGCGGGDLIAAIAGSLRKHKIDFIITGIDGNANSLAFAQKRCGGFNEISFLQDDILDPSFKIKSCDILISSHFMYHFSEERFVHFLKNNLPSISTAVIFSELKRNRFALMLFKTSSFLLPISNLAKEDGLLAIKRSFNKKEWQSILQDAGIEKYRLQTVPLFRILLTILPTGKV